jgi:hypothetical protein
MRGLKRTRHISDGPEAGRHLVVQSDRRTASRARLRESERLSLRAHAALQPEEDESQRCQFCSYRGKLTQEHLWPAAFKKYFPELRSARTHHQRFDTYNPLGGHEWDALPFDSTVGIDCNVCNNQRLRGIEVEAAPWVWGMARGFRDPTALPPTAQGQLAAFALRMVTVGQYTQPRLRPVPRAHREHLVTQRTHRRWLAAGPSTSRATMQRFACKRWFKEC